ncbi:putative F-box protein At1g30920 [Triticum dicoccoides]|uniref:putative F-box protein At1g30920 n=1 Tax=Triticum dicoccoides TaxID=85692 RepID=UPI00188E6630|nr:putative F-box protein At1g30920 [Triticum dicoccoides]
MPWGENLDREFLGPNAIGLQSLRRQRFLGRRRRHRPPLATSVAGAADPAGRSPFPLHLVRSTALPAYFDYLARRKVAAAAPYRSATAEGHRRRFLLVSGLTLLIEMRTVASLTDDLLVEILSRLPVKSLRRCMCVSRTWRGIISHPQNQRQLPQTLEGFFYMPKSKPAPAPYFTDVIGTVRPLVSPLSDFLPQHQSIFLLSCCNGLLLCRCWEGQDDFHYVVCNPATEEWVRLPDSVNAGTECMARLAFDPAVSDHFHVFEFSEGHDICQAGMEVYSSKTGGWVHKENGWIDTEDDEACVSLVGHHSGDVFLNGCLHFVAMDPGIVAAVDTEGKTWRNIPVPAVGSIPLIQKSQGCLHFATFVKTDGMVLLVVFVLENYRGQEWILKHCTDASYIFGEREIHLILGFQWVAMHPDCNVIFLTVGWDNTLVSYDMDHHKVQEICDLGGDDSPRYLPYVPLYSELQTLHQ